MTLHHTIFKISRGIPYIIIGIGILLRVTTFLLGNELWLDEAMLANNVISRGFFGLLRPLSYGQSAPIGFLFVSKLMTLITNSYSPFVYHLIPLISGITSLFVINALLKLLKHNVLIRSVLLSLVSFSPFLITYSSEFKQYSTELLLVSLYLYLWIRFLKDMSLKNVLGLGITAIATTLFVQPAVLIIFPTGLLSLYYAWTFQTSSINYSPLRYLIFSYFTSALTSIVNLLPLLFADRNRDYLKNYWQEHGGFLHIEKLFRNTSRLETGNVVPTLSSTIPTEYEWLMLTIFSLFLFIALYSLFTQKKQIDLLIGLLLSIVLIYCASAFQLFPLNNRLSLYVIPLTSILYAFGLEFLLRNKWNLSKLLFGIIVVSLLLFQSHNFLQAKTVLNGTNQYKNTHLQGVRAAIRELSNKDLSNTTLVFDRLGKSVFDYYWLISGTTIPLRDVDWVATASPAQLQDLIQSQPTERFWIVPLYERASLIDQDLSTIQGVTIYDTIIHDETKFLLVGTP
ncbi:MAG: hypothetical protein QY312_01600 [Candidatus Dojkabacteria bacterium]|nr:MAG: hypothetical protein QY312_01600 [Candidatus Dojkabacteria bacterium]